jgi:hypothetical protein
MTGPSTEGYGYTIPGRFSGSCTKEDHDLCAEITRQFESRIKVLPKRIFDGDSEVRWLCSASAVMTRYDGKARIMIRSVSKLKSGWESDSVIAFYSFAKDEDVSPSDVADALIIESQSIIKNRAEKDGWKTV